MAHRRRHAQLGAFVLVQPRSTVDLGLLIPDNVSKQARSTFDPIGAAIEWRRAMANQEHLDLLRQGVKVWNAWRQEHGDVLVDLREADLCEADLNKVYLIGADLSEVKLDGAQLNWAELSKTDLWRADLRKADLRKADLRKVDLSAADFGEANLSATELSQANLSGADLSGADLSLANIRLANLFAANLSGVNLSGADLQGTYFDEANLSGADLSLSILDHTTFADCDLSMAIGLATTRHNGPSSVDINTLYRSQGKIPEAFLRGCGVPDTLIEYLPALLGAFDADGDAQSCVEVLHKPTEGSLHLKYKVTELGEARLAQASKGCPGGSGSVDLHKQGGIPVPLDREDLTPSTRTATASCVSPGC
jgi:uncharacterized protein YjbI with pentapeptide repeats